MKIVIPSRTLSNLRPCLEAIWRNEPELPRESVIVVDDGLSERPDGPMYIDGIKPFIFARACNAGIVAAGSDSVVLSNDDALLETPGGFTKMQTAAQSKHANYGLISATTNHAGNPAQNRRAQHGVRYCGNTPGNSFPVVAFVCVLIPRATIEKIGLLDERFTAYGWEDNDYCRRVNNANLMIGICDGCYVDHLKLTSTFRGGAAIGGDIAAGRKIYLDKWGGV